MFFFWKALYFQELRKLNYCNDSSSVCRAYVPLADSGIYCGEGLGFKSSGISVNEPSSRDSISAEIVGCMENLEKYS